MKNKVMFLTLIISSLTFSACTPYNPQGHMGSAKSCSNCETCSDASCKCESCGNKDKKVCPYAKDKAKSCCGGSGSCGK